MNESNSTIIIALILLVGGSAFFSAKNVGIYSMNCLTLGLLLLEYPLFLEDLHEPWKD